MNSFCRTVITNLDLRFSLRTFDFYIQSYEGFLKTQHVYDSVALELLSRFESHGPGLSLETSEAETYADRVSVSW